MARCTAPSRGHRTASAAEACPAPVWRSVSLRHLAKVSGLLSSA